MDKTLIWWVPFCAGGLCDRLLGMITTYSIAEALGRKFLIKWDQNDLSAVLTINPEYNYYTYNVPYSDISLSNYESMTYFETTNLEEAWKDKPHVLIWSNLNLFQHFCKQHPEINYQETLLRNISLIFTEFLLPTEKVKRRTDLSEAIGIHIRTHDSQLDDPIKKTEQMPYIIDILTRCKARLKEGERVFISYDCEYTPRLAQTILSAQTLVFNDGPIVHTGREQPHLNEEGLTKAIVDLFSLSQCKELYLGWHTNFSRMGALLNPNRNFYTYEHPQHPDEIVPCDLLELMNYFSYGWRMFDKAMPQSLCTLSEESSLLIQIGEGNYKELSEMSYANPNLRMIYFDSVKPDFTLSNLQFIIGDTRETVSSHIPELENSADFIIINERDYLKANLAFFNSRGIAKHNARVVFRSSHNNLWKGYRDQRLVKESSPLIGKMFKPKIGVCSLAIGEAYKDSVKYAMRSKSLYAQKHGYGYHIDGDVFDTSRPPAWSKINILKKYLADYDYLVWMDADLLVMNDELKLEMFIYDYMENAHMMAVREWLAINTGVLFVKNTDWSFRFLEYIYTKTEFLHHPQWEQTAFNQLFEKDEMDSQNRVKILPLALQYLFNSYWYNYYPGHFALHLAGCFRDGVDRGLKREIAKVCPIRMDEESEDEYLARKDWLKHGVREYFDQQLKVKKQFEKMGIYH